MTTPTTQREADERALMEAGCARRYSDGDYKHTSILMRLSTERDAYRAGWKDRAAIDQSTRQAAQAGEWGKCQLYRGAPQAATTASASIGDEMAAEFPSIEELRRHAPAPSREAAPLDVKRWEQRLNAVDPAIRVKSVDAAKDAEIADLRAALARAPLPKE